MIIQIDFNHEVDDDTLKQLASFVENTDEYDAYFIEITTIDELQQLMKKVNELKTSPVPYCALINFVDEPIIFFDNKS